MPPKTCRDVLLTVRDRGIGIRAADLPHVFERFRRGGNIRGIAGGSGIGLSNVKQIVQQHGGTVAIASREGEGTTSLRVAATRTIRPRRRVNQ